MPNAFNSSAELNLRNNNNNNLMIKELLEKDNGANSWIIRELIEIIIDEEIGDLKQLQQYQDRDFTINNIVLSREEQIDRVEKILQTEFTFTSEEVDCMSFEQYNVAREMLNQLSDRTIEGDAEIMILIAKLETMLKDYPHFPFDDYKLIIEGKL